MAISEEQKSRNYTAMLFFILVAQAVGGAASLVTEPNVASWYPGLVKPSFDPPNWLFAPVWVTLYFLMAIAAWRVWRLRGLNSTPLILYAIQLALNFVWSFIFFGAHQVLFGLMEIAMLLVFIIATTVAFFRDDVWAGMLMLPYIAWVGFATALNAAIWKLNG
ncbi:MAG TPA: TspO/MBR family protein [Rhizomicrobium sp.]|nr:TspO/MBR family protein [Rhizomicrobium sp.]